MDKKQSNSEETIVSDDELISHAKDDLYYPHAEPTNLDICRLTSVTDTHKSLVQLSGVRLKSEIHCPYLESKTETSVADTTVCTSDVSGKNRAVIKWKKMDRSKNSILIEKLQSTPTETTIDTTPISTHLFTPRSDNEGKFFEDYMQFLVEEPDIELYVPELSTISSSNISCVAPELERTIAIVKPAGMVYRDAVLRAIVEAGFQVIGIRMVHLTPEQVAEIYQKYYGSAKFPQIVVSSSCAPLLALSLASLDAVERWNKIVGPKGMLRDDWFFPISVRCQFGLRDGIPHALHASRSIAEATWENRYFYPDSMPENLMTEEIKVTDYFNMYVNPTLLNGLTEVVRKKPLDPILYLAEWLLLNNPFQPRLPTKIAKTAT